LEERPGLDGLDSLIVVFDSLAMSQSDPLRRGMSMANQSVEGRNFFFEQVAYLPLLHKLVEERAGKRRFPSPYPSPRWRGARGRKCVVFRGHVKN
jgi:hypothetical protein